MPFVTPEITCNLQWRSATRQLAYAKQGEYNSRKIAVQLYDGANRFTFTPGTYTGELAYKRPDGAGRAYSTIDDAVAVELDGTTGTAVITLEPEVLAIAGIVECELRLKTSGSLLATFTFGYYVEQSVIQSDTPSPSPDPGPTPTPTGEKTKFFGFETLTAYNQFVTQNPGVLVDGDIVVIKSVNGSDTVHTFYVLVGSTLTSRHVITVPPAGSSGASTMSALGGGYGVCSSLKTTTAKIVRIDGFVRTQNVPFQVKFNYDVESGDTLNVRSSSSASSGTGACALRWNGANVPDGLIIGGCTATLVYDGTYYQVLDVSPVTAPMIADGAVTGAKLSNDIQTALTAAGTAVQPSALAAYIPKAAQANAENFSPALVIAPAGVDSNGAIKSPVAVYGTVTRSGSAGSYTYSANISAVALYAIQQVYPHMRAFLVDHLGRECTLIKPPASDQDSLVFYTLDKANKKIVYYTVATSGATTVAEDAYNGGGGSGGTPTWEDILPEDGIPQTDLAKETVTITAGSGTPVTYSSDKTFAQISTANTAGKLIVPVFNGFEGRCIDVGQNAATFEVIDATNPSAPVQYIFVVSATGCAGAAANWGSGGGGSGAELFEVYLTNNAGTYTASETVADIMAAYNSGMLVKYYNDVGAEGLLFATPTAYGITFVCFDDSDGGHPTMMTIYSIAADGTVTVSSEDILNSLITPGAQTRTNSQMASGLLAISNVVYTITGDATGFVLTNTTNPITTPGECIEIRLTVGSTAITTPTWPSWCNLMDGWDGTFAANTAYVILIDDAGNVYHSTREVSA